MTNAGQSQMLSNLRENDVVGVIGSVFAIEDGQILIRFDDPLHGEDALVPFSHDTLRLIRRTVRVGDHVVHPDGRNIIVKAIIDDAMVSYCEPGADTAVIGNLGHVELGLLTYKDQISQKTFGTKLMPMAEPQDPEIESGLSEDASTNTPVDGQPSEKASNGKETNGYANSESTSAQDASEPVTQAGSDPETEPSQANADANANDTMNDADQNSDPASPATPKLRDHEMDADEASRSIEAIRSNRQQGKADIKEFPKNPRDV